MDGPFMNRLKWQLDCIESLLQNKGVHHRRCLPPSSITITYRCCLSLSSIAAVACYYYLLAIGNSNG